MQRVFERHGIRFEFPEDWILHEQESSGEISVTVNSPETSFWSLTLLLDRPDPHDVMEAVIGTLREEYSELDVYPSESRLGDSRTVARDVDFVCHELIGSAFLRVTATSQFTLLVLFQAADFELDETLPILERISQSLHWDSVASDELDGLDLFAVGKLDACPDDTEE